MHIIYVICVWRNQYAQMRPCELYRIGVYVQLKP